jgi:hypothetical protein
MESPGGADELQVSDTGLRAHAGWCETLASELAGNSPPAVTGPSWLATTDAVNASHAEVAAAGVRCTNRMQATATKLATAATGYAENELGRVVLR